MGIEGFIGPTPMAAPLTAGYHSVTDHLIIISLVPPLGNKEAIAPFTTACERDYKVLTQGRKWGN